MTKKERRATADAVLAALKESRLRRAAGDDEGATETFMRARRWMVRLSRGEQRRVMLVDAGREAREQADARHN